MLTLIRALFKLILLGAVIAGVLWGGDLLMDARTTARLENRAHELFNDGQYEEAAAAYIKTIRKLQDTPAFARDPARLDKLRRLVARCYIRRAEEPSLPLTESLELYRRALDYDPDAELDENIRKLLDRKRQR